MRVLIYTPSPGIPPEAEAIAEQYDEEDHQILYRNGSAWRGEIERGGQVYAHQEEIRDAYEASGIPAEPLFTEPDPVDEPEEGKDFYIRARGSGWYDVVSEEGEPANTDALREKEAKDLRDSLNSGEVA